MTTVDATGTGLRVQQTDTYVLGTQQYRTDIQITNGGPVTQTGALYRAGDCYLQENDEGYGRVDDGSSRVHRRPASSTSRIEQWTPLTPGSHYMEDYYGYVYYAVNGQQFPEHVRVHVRRERRRRQRRRACRGPSRWVPANR